MKRLITVTAAFALGLGLVLGAGAATAKPKKAGGHQRSVSDAADVADIVFSEIERRIIHDYFGLPGDYHGGKAKGLPPGLAKRDQLPPGLAKRDRLPPGLAKRDLPSGLHSRLGPARHGTRRYIVGNDVLLIEAATGIVLDIIYDVVTSKN